MMMMMMKWQQKCQNLKKVMMMTMMAMMLGKVIVTITMVKVRTVDRHDELAVVLMCVLWIDMCQESVSASNVER